MQGLLKEAVDTYLADERFRLPTDIGPVVINTASALCSWMEDTTNEEEITAFSACLSCKMRGCFSYNSSGKLKKDNMWGLYHQMRTSEEFIKEWIKFLAESTGIQHLTPIFYQFMTDNIFKQLIKIDHPIQAVTSTTPQQSLSSFEQNALQ